MKLKIGITCYPTVGGSGVIATELGKLLAKNGHEIHFITSSIPFRLKEWTPNIYFHEVQVNQYSVFKYPPYDLALASKMAEIAKREKLHLLHVHYAVPHAVSAYLAKQMVGDHLKIMTTLHGTDITVLGYDPSLIDMIRFGIEQSDKVTAVSNDLVIDTKQLLKTDKEIVPVYNFINERTFQKKVRKDLKSQLKIEEDEKVIIHISNFRKVKRVDDVVRVFYEVQKKIKAKLLLIGDGPELPIICNMINELGLKKSVLLFGNQENVSDILSISDLNLLLSEKESFGLTLLEAMACGVPCVGTNVGGIPEVIEHGKTGLVGELGNIEDLTEKALYILQNETIHQSMGEQSIMVANNKFSSTKIVEQYENLYYEMLPEIAKI